MHPGRAPALLLAIDGPISVAVDVRLTAPAYAGFSLDKGERLFLDDGGQTDFLKHALKLVQDYQAHTKRTGELANRLMEWDLFQPLQANIELRAGDKMSLTGFMAVDPNKLKALQPERLAELAQLDNLGVVYYHLLSLNNFGRLVDKVAEAA